jgi:hypothetical protein
MWNTGAAFVLWYPQAAVFGAAFSVYDAWACIFVEDSEVARTTSAKPNSFVCKSIAPFLSIFERWASSRQPADFFAHGFGPSDR